MEEREPQGNPEGAKIIPFPQPEIKKPSKIKSVLREVSLAVRDSVIGGAFVFGILMGVEIATDHRPPNPTPQQQQLNDAVSEWLEGQK